MTTTPAAAVPNVEPEHILVAREFLRAKNALDAWKAHKDKASAKLLELHAEGSCPTKVVVDGFILLLTDGRETDAIDDEGKEQIERLKDILAESGHITTKKGDPFWTPRKITEPKPKKARRAAAVPRNQESLDDEDCALAGA
jgi:hypothetical protein